MPTNCKVGMGEGPLHPGFNDALTDVNPGRWHGMGDEEFDSHMMASIVEPEDDIERRINEQITKTLGEILSEAINRCISTSLEGCIDLDD